MKKIKRVLCLTALVSSISIFSGCGVILEPFGDPWAGLERLPVSSPEEWRKATEEAKKQKEYYDYSGFPTTEREEPKEKSEEEKEQPYTPHYREQLPGQYNPRGDISSPYYPGRR